MNSTLRERTEKKLNLKKKSFLTMKKYLFGSMMLTRCVRKTINSKNFLRNQNQLFHPKTMVTYYLTCIKEQITLTSSNRYFFERRACYI